LIEKASSHSSGKQRAKVEKAIKNASKKSRTLSKTSPQSRSKLRKDPGVPNLFPFKDKVLREIDESRQSLLNERQQRKDAQEAAKNSMKTTEMEVELSGIARLAQLAEQRGNEYGNDMMMDDTPNNDLEEKSTKKDTSRKTYNKEFKKVMEQADVILYVLDARDPESTRSKDIETMIRESAHGEKQLIFILNKIGTFPPRKV
jgi:nuclear GTP-binding protein